MSAFFSDALVRGRTLRLASMERPPFVTIRRTANGSPLYGGYCFELIHILQSICNFSYTVSSPPDRMFGTETAAGNWSGMIGMILQNESDMAIGPFSVTYARQQVIDFTTSFFEEPTTILIPPPSRDMKPLACIEPFKKEVWIGILLMVALISVTFSILSWVHNSHRKELIKNSLITFGVLTGQPGLTTRMTRRSPRLLISFWCLVSLVFIHAYVGTLASFLSVPKFKAVIAKLEDLPSSKLTWIVRQGTELESFFMEANEGVYKTIGDGLRQWPDLLTKSANTIGPARVADGTSVYIVGKSFSQFTIADEYKRTRKCQMDLAKEEFYKAIFAFVLPKGSLLKPFFDNKIQQIIESGIADYWRRRLWPSTNECDISTKKYGPRPLTLTDVFSLFMIWVCGMVLAAVSFTLEIALALMSKHYSAKRSSDK